MVWSYGISTIVDFLLSNPLYIYIYIYIYIFFKKKQRNWSQRIINLFPSCYAFLKFPKNTKKKQKKQYFFRSCKHILLIMFLKEFNIICLHTVKWFQVLLCITNNSFKLQSFVYTQLNDKTVLFLTIQFSISHLFAYSLNIKQFYLTHWYEPIRVFYSGPVWTLEQWQ